jgi:hypothetical protein
MRELVRPRNFRMAWLMVVIISLVCVAFSFGFVVGATVAAFGIRARQPKPPPAEPPVENTENATVYYWPATAVIPFDQEDE